MALQQYRERLCLMGIQYTQVLLRIVWQIEHPVAMSTLQVRTAMCIGKQVLFVEKTRVALCIERLTRNTCPHKAHQSPVNRGPVYLFLKMVRQLPESKGLALAH